MSASRFPHTARQGKEEFVATAPKASDERFDYTRFIKCANRAEERVFRKQRANRVIGILDKSAAAINAELAREAAEAERLSRDFWRNFKRQVKPEETQTLQKRKPQIEEDEPPIWFRKLPSYDHDIVDSMGLTGVFAEFKYLSAPRTTYGVAKRLVYYITKPESIEYLHDGSPAVLSNVGIDRDEYAIFMSMLEDVHRGSRANAKIVVSAILQLPYEVTTETRLDIMREWCEQNLGVHDLPYVAGLHPPSREGDQRNYHAHVIFAYRPMRRHGRYDWDLNRFLRTDLDDPHFFTILRSNFAQSMTEHVQKAGIDRIYTGLSNAARGIVHKPVPKLKPHIVRVFRDGGYVMDVERTEALIAMNTRREMAYEALRNKVLEEIEARFDDFASGAYRERHRPRPFVPLPAAQIGLPQRDRAIGEASADAPHPASLQLPRPSKSVATPPTPKLLCPKPAAMPIESAPKAAPKLPVAMTLADALPAPSQKLLLSVRAVMPSPPAEQRGLMRMVPVSFSAPEPVSRTLYLPARAKSVPSQSEPARLMLPAKVVPSNFTHTQPKLPKAADWSMLPAHTQTTVMKCPVASYPVPPVADVPTLKIAARAYLPQALRTNAALLRPSPAKPVPEKAAQPKPKLPVAAVIPPPPSRQSPLRLPKPASGYDQPATPTTHVETLLVSRRAGPVSPAQTSPASLKLPVKVAFTAPQPQQQPLLDFRDYVTVYEEAEMRAGKNSFADENERMLKALTESKPDLPNAPSSDVSTIASLPASPRHSSASQSVAPHDSGPSQTSHRAAQPAPNGPRISSAPPEPSPNRPITAQTPQQLIAVLKAMDSFMLFDDNDHIGLSKNAKQRLNVDNTILYAPQTNDWYKQQKAAQDRFLHAIILKAGKPVRTPKEFAAIPFTPGERARLNGWLSDPDCKAQLDVRILQIMATFKTRKPPAQSRSGLPVEPQLYSCDELKGMMTKGSTAGGHETSLAHFLARLPEESHKFTADAEGKLSSYICGLTVRIGLAYWESDPNISKIIDDTLRLTRAKGSPVKPIYPPEVAIAMEVYRREEHRPPNPKRALHCPAQTIVGSAPAATLAPPMKARNMANRLPLGRGQEMGQKLGPERQRDD